MGLAGLSGGWRLAVPGLGAPTWVAPFIGWIAILFFLATFAAYGVKAFRHPAAVRDEFRHPIFGNLFGTFPISLLLLPLILVHLNLLLARAVWVAGVLGTVLIAWMIVTRWITVRQEPLHITPTWIIPVVGILDVPAAVPLLKMPQVHGVMVFALAVGLFFTIPIFNMNFARLANGPPLQEALSPTLLMLEAPFPVGFTAYVVTRGHDDFFADLLYMLTLFMFAVFSARVLASIWKRPFKLTWWGTSFPLAATAVASIRYSRYHPEPANAYIAAALLTVATLAIGGLLFATLVALGTGRLRSISR